jgi:methionyl-tRNA synthetase
MSRFYVTTPIYYVNDVPHLGHAYTTITVDALRRYHLLRGDETRMLTGTDEHGLKIEREAQERGKTPIGLATEMSAHFRALWPKLEIVPDDFIRTTEKRHEDLAQELWKTVAAKGDIYLDHYEGWYCVGCEELKTEKELLPGNICPLHQRPVERIKEESYFFRLSKYQQPLLELYEKHPEFAQPESRRNEVVSFVKGGLRDLSVSRTSFKWGVPVPGDPKHVMYVWFDALANYWTAVQDSASHKKFWDDGTVVHIVGKDILRFHAVYWPAFLMSAGLPLPKTVYAHGFLTINGQKMSKALRNAVEPLGIARAFGRVAGSDEAGADVLRYQLLRAIAFGQDGDLDLAAMVERYNADLGKNLGNLLARTLGLCTKLTAGKRPAAPKSTDLEKDLLNEAKKAALRARDEWDAISPHRALEVTWSLSSAANTYVDRAAPWAEAKKGDQARVETILATLLEVLRILSVMIWPVLPKKSDEMRAQLGLSPLAPKVGQDVWPSGAELLPEGPLAPGAPLFPTVDEDGARALLETLTPRVPAEGANASAAASANASASGSGTASAAATAAATAPGTASPSAISYEQFLTVDLRVGLVRSAERIPKKDKLLLLKVDVGEPEPRQIVAGLALSFQPEDLVGKRVIVVANLAPREFGKGLVSHGMLLATGPSEKLTLATVAAEVEPGAKLK